MGALAAIVAVALSAAPASRVSPEVVEILTRHECHRCHVAEGVQPLPLARDCAGCHVDIASAAEDPKKLKKGHKVYGKAFDRFIASTAPRYCNIPQLSSMERFRASWLKQYLGAPYDIRPNVVESMIRHNLTPAEIDTLVSGWRAAPDGPSPQRPSAERLARGELLFNAKSCGTCHLFGNRPFEVAEGWQFTELPKVRLRAMAPDLQHARNRLPRATLEAWIADPASVKPTAVMPNMKVNAEEAALLADFVTFADLGAPSTVAVRRAPAFDPKAPVPAYEEVEAKVFHALCWHCHSNPDFTDGDGGPGNTGGFGFPAIRLSFASFEEVMSGSVGPDGERRSLFRKGDSGEPVILERLRERYLENDRDHVAPGKDRLVDRRAAPSSTARGMPLGLPALTDEQFSLVERWVKGGRPGPAQANAPAPVPLRGIAGR
jgi:mono/diheme cytochrome c family protein